LNVRVSSTSHSVCLSPQVRPSLARQTLAIFPITSALHDKCVQNTAPRTDGKIMPIVSYFKRCLQEQYAMLTCLPNGSHRGCRRREAIRSEEVRLPEYFFWCFLCRSGTCGRKVVLPSFRIPLTRASRLTRLFILLPCRYLGLPSLQFSKILE